MLSFPAVLSFLLLSLLSVFTTAQSSNNTSSAVFVYDGGDDTQFTFALTAEQRTGDLYFHLSTTSENSWVAVGIGNQMKDALMIIAYPEDDGDSVTLSPRIGSGHTEPAYTSDITLNKIGGGNANTADGNDRGFSNIAAEGVCKRCANWKTGTLNFESKAQPFIFAVGPPFPTVDSNSLSAGLNEHSFYGQFTMDMTAATVQSGAAVPAGPYVLKDASKATDTNDDNNPASRIHGLVMGFVFVILLPLGAMLLRIWHALKGHIIVQTLGLVLFCMAFAGGCVVSGLYIRSKNFNSAHQIIGILLLIAMLSQWTLGFTHHQIFKKEQRKTIMGKIHRYLGPAIIFFGVFNGGLGFRLAGAAFLAIPYAIIVIIIAIIFIAISLGVPYYRRRKGTRKGPEGYQHGPFGGSAPPGYAPPPGPPPSDYPPPYGHGDGQDVPLTRFASSRTDVDAAPVQPRPMV